MLRSILIGYNVEPLVPCHWARQCPSMAPSLNLTGEDKVKAIFIPVTSEVSIGWFMLWTHLWMLVLESHWILNGYGTASAKNQNSSKTLSAHISPAQCGSGYRCPFGASEGIRKETIFLGHRSTLIKSRKWHEPKRKSLTSQGRDFSEFQNIICYQFAHGQVLPSKRKTNLDHVDLRAATERSIE